LKESQENGRRRLANGEKVQPTNTKFARALQRKAKRKPKEERPVCGYCGDDLSPSFIKRCDRRCRKCFSKRYGSASRAKKLKANKWI